MTTPIHEFEPDEGSPDRCSYRPYDRQTKTHTDCIWGKDMHPVFTQVVAAADVTDEVLDIAQEVEESWFSDEAKIDWESFQDRLDGYPLKDGTQIDIGSEYDTPAMRKIQKHIRALRRMG